MNGVGLLLGLASLVIMGLGFAWVILGERYFGYLWWPYGMAVGIVLVVASLWLRSLWLSALVGVLGASIIWGATELEAQAVRAELGWFPFRAHKINPPLVQLIRKWRPPHG
jgi:hypothetical protein